MTVLLRLAMALSVVVGMAGPAAAWPNDEDVAAPKDLGGYKLHMKEALPGGWTAEFWRDGRVTKTLADAWHNCQEPPAEQAKVFAAAPVRNAVLRLRDAQGNTVQTLALERPLGWISQRELRSARPYLLLTVEYTDCQSSHSGSMTFPVEVTDGKLGQIGFKDGDGGEASPMALLQGKEDRWLPVKTAAGFDILEAFLSRDEVSGKATLNLNRYRWNGADWVRRHKEKRGDDWHYDGPDSFPPVHEFP